MPDRGDQAEYQDDTFLSRKGNKEKKRDEMNMSILSMWWCQNHTPRPDHILTRKTCECSFPGRGALKLQVELRWFTS